MSTVSLNNKHILITGAANGIGRAAALAAAESGAASVTLVDIGSLVESEAIISSKFPKTIVKTITADVTDARSVEGYVEATVEEFGRIDGFFNNAGISGAIAPLSELDPEDFDRVIAVNLRGVFLGLRYVLPVMVAQKSGAVVCTGSLASERGLTLTGGYNAAKSGVLGLVRTAAAECGKDGVRINAVEPGMIRTNLLASITESLNPGTGADAGARMEAAGAQVAPLARAGAPEEVADGVVFLLSEDARYITGSALPIDGGALAVMAHPTS